MSNMNEEEKIDNLQNEAPLEGEVVVPEQTHSKSLEIRTVENVMYTTLWHRTSIKKFQILRKSSFAKNTIFQILPPTCYNWVHVVITCSEHTCCDSHYCCCYS